MQDECDPLHCQHGNNGPEDCHRCQAGLREWPQVRVERNFGKQWGQAVHLAGSAGNSVTGRRGKDFIGSDDSCQIEVLNSPLI